MLEETSEFFFETLNSLFVEFDESLLRGKFLALFDITKFTFKEIIHSNHHTTKLFIKKNLKASTLRKKLFTIIL